VKEERRGEEKRHIAERRPKMSEHADSETQSQAWSLVDAAEIASDAAGMMSAPVAAPVPGKAPSMEIEVKLVPCGENEQDCSLQVVVPPISEKNRSRAHLICVIDISGSMGADASVISANGEKESSGLSVLDLVKHSIRTKLSILQPTDEISLITFSDVGEVLLRCQKCDEDGKRVVEKKLEEMQPTGCTNLWDGLKQGLDLVKDDGERLSKNTTIFLLTDGMPNIAPPRGHIETLGKYIEDVGDLPCAINTYGFGYSLDSELLESISRLGAGQFSFIPDAGMVGTVFIHACANALAVKGQDSTMNIAMLDAELAPETEAALKAQFPVMKTPWGWQVRVGSIQYGQTRVFPFKLIRKNQTQPQSMEISVSYKENAIRAKAVEATVSATATDQEKDRILLAHQRINLVTCIHNILQVAASWTRSELAGVLKNLEPKVRATAAGIQGNTRNAKSKDTAAQLEKYQKDLTGEIMQAVAHTDSFSRWGQHYLRSLKGAHVLQTANNFKDPGVQAYGETQPFASLREAAENGFASLAPPKPSRKPDAAPISRAAMANMYLNVSRPCVAGQCQVSMADGSQKLVEDVCKGDRVLSNDGATAVVTCVLKTVIEDQELPLACFKTGLKITPYHPVLDTFTKKWNFPCNIADIVQVRSNEVPAVYSFVLDGGHYLEVDGIPCISLGHGLRDDPVASHPYLATSKVLEDLSYLPGWQNGLIVARDNCFVRNPATDLLCGIDKEGIL